MLKIGTNANKLALWQAEFTQAELQRVGVESELVTIKNEHENGSFSDKKIEEALLRGDIDLAVYSMENCSTDQPEGLVITAVSNRENPADLLLLRPEAQDKTQIFKIKSGAVVGISSARRGAQLRDFRPDIEFLNLRENTLSRLQNLREGACDAIFLAAADVKRMALNLSDLEILELNPREFIPAPAQGVLAWQTHRNDLPTRRILKQLHHSEIAALTNIERKVLQLLGGSSDLPIGVFAARDGLGNYHAFAACELEGRMRRTRISQNTSAGLAEKLAAALRAE